MNLERKELASCHSGDTSTKLELVVDMDTGETEVMVIHTITETMSVTDHNKAKELFDQLTTGTRRKWRIKDLIKG